MMDGRFHRAPHFGARGRDDFVIPDGNRPPTFGQPRLLQARALELAAVLGGEVGGGGDASALVTRLDTARSRTQTPSVRYRSMASTASPKSTETAVKQTAKSVEQQTRKVADTARELKHSSARIEDSADRTTVLAADRNILASERTYAAWVRTGLLALAGGIAARALKDVPNWLVLANGTLLITFSLFCFGAAVWRHFHPGPPPPSPSVKVMPWPALVVAMMPMLDIR
jgi:putative membrane protein